MDITFRQEKLRDQIIEKFAQSGEDRTRPFIAYYEQAGGDEPIFGFMTAASPEDGRTRIRLAFASAFSEDFTRIVRAASTEDDAFLETEGTVRYWWMMPGGR